jgi:Ser/Thr protein kinase RdoA (MazF antagonist)
MAHFSIPVAMSDSCLLPQFDAAQTAAIAQRLFALQGPMKLLHGERDLNYRISDARGRFVFKIANADESPDMLDCQHQVFERLQRERVLPLVACALESVNGKQIEIVEDAAGRQHYCRVLPFLEGRMWSDFEVSSPELLQDLGSKLAALDRALAGFAHPGLERPLLWNMETTGVALAAYKPLLANDDERKLVEHFESGYLARVLAVQGQLRRGVIHNDANRENVIVDESGKRVTSIIDFGDMIHSWLVLEPGIAATYSMMGQPDPMASALALVRGYHQSMALTETEIGLLFDLIGMRLCMSVCLCAHQQRLEPDNAYLSIDVQDSWNLLRQLESISWSAARDRMMAACSLG